VSEAVFVALLGFAGTLMGSLLGVLTTQKLTSSGCRSWRRRSANITI